MVVDLQALRQRVESGLLTEQKHNQADLIIWNYTPKCQYERAWDEYTSICRGLITDLSGTVVARPFPKFFNVGETPETAIEKLPLTLPDIYEKMDGSLGIQYYVGNEVLIATRGSFNSDQAEWATTWVKARFRRSDFLDGFTYLYEIIYPENRIVIDYGSRAELVLLAVVNTEDGEELDLQAEADRLKLATPRRISHASVSSALAEAENLDGNEEGFVCRYSNGLRVKIKGKEYVRLHKLITGFSSKSIWECLMTGQDIGKLLERVPDEFYAWVQQTKTDLLSKYEAISSQCVKDYTNREHGLSRKETALYFLNCQYPGILFSMLDKKDYSHQIWRMVKPKYELPFRKDADQ